MITTAAQVLGLSLAPSLFSLPWLALFTDLTCADACNSYCMRGCESTARSGLNGRWISVWICY